MKRTVFNLYIKENIPVRDFLEIENDFKTLEISEHLFFTKIKYLIQDIFAEDYNLKNIIKIAQETHVLLHLISTDNAVLALPWEIFFNEFPLIGLSRGNTPLEECVPPKKDSKLNVLIILSSPYGQKELNKKEETMGLFSGFMSDTVDIVFTDDGSLQALEKALKQKVFDVIYYSGHGHYKNGASVLYFETQLFAKAREVSGHEFVQSIIQHSKTLPKLVVLSSCNTALGNIEFKGVSNLLLENDIPAVISFSDAIEQGQATGFFKTFSNKLMKKYDILDAFRFSVNDLKRQYPDPHQSRVAWLAPNLFLKKHIEQFVGYEEDNTFENGFAKSIFETKQYVPHIHQKEIRFLANKVLEGNAKVNIAGHRGIGKSSCVSYVAENLKKHISGLKVLLFDSKTCSVENFQEDMSKLIGIPIVDLKNDLQRYSKANPLLIIIDDVEEQVVVNNNRFEIIDNEVLAFVKHIDSVHVFLVTRLPIVNDVFEILKFRDIPTPHLFYMFKNSFLGDYVKLSVSNISLSSLYNSHPLYLLIKKLFEENMFGGIAEFYVIFEYLISRNYNKNQKFINIQEFISNYDELIKKTLYFYERIDEVKKGYWLLPYLNEFEPAYQKILKTTAFFGVAVKKDIIRIQNPEIQDFENIFKKLVDLNLIEMDISEGGKKIFRTQTLLSVSKQLSVNINFDKTSVAKYLVKHIDEELENPNFAKENKGTVLNYLNWTYKLGLDVNNTEIIRDIGIRLCNTYCENNSPDEAIWIGKKAYERLKDDTPVEILQSLFIAYQAIGNIAEANTFRLEFEKKSKLNGNELDIIDSIRYQAIMHTENGEYANACQKFDEVLYEIENSPLKDTEEFRYLHCAVLSDSVNALRRNNHIEGAYKKAEDRLLKAREITNLLKEDSSLILDNLSALYMEYHQPFKALKYSEQTLIKSHLYNHISAEMNSLMKQGVLYMENHQFGNSKYVLNQVIYLAKLRANSIIQAEANKHMGHVFLLEGELMEIKRKECKSYFKEAINYFDKAETNFEKRHNSAQLFLVYGMMATCYSKILDYEQSISFRKKQLDIAQQLEDLEQELVVYTAIGIDYSKQNNFTEAMHYYKIHNDKIEIVLELGNLDQGFIKKLLSKKMFCYLLMANALLVQINSEEGYYNYSELAFNLYFEEELNPLPYSIERQFVSNVSKFLTMNFQSKYQSELGRLVNISGNKYL